MTLNRLWPCTKLAQVRSTTASLGFDQLLWFTKQTQPLHAIAAVRVQRMPPGQLLYARK
jgi:hypothetical protein